MRKPVTAARVARLAGVSVVTVSRAFNGSPLVNETTRARVLAAAQELGYRPGSAARAQNRGRTGSLGVVLRARHLSGSFHAELLGGFYSAVQGREISVLLSIAPESENVGEWMQQLGASSTLDGLAVHHSVAQDAGARLIRSLPIPVVVAGLIPDACDEELELTSVGFDHADGIQQAVRHLIALGHRDIAYFDNYGPPSGISRRAPAFREEMAEAGIEVRPDWILDCSLEDGSRAGSEAIQRIFSRKPPHPTAVACASDWIAAGVVAGARAWGRRVPEDLSVTGYGNSTWTPIFNPPLTSVHQRGWDLGAALGRELLAQCNGSGNTGWCALPLHLTVRESTAPPAMGWTAPPPPPSPFERS